MVAFWSSRREKMISNYISLLLRNTLSKAQVLAFHRKSTCKGPFPLRFLHWFVYLFLVHPAPSCRFRTDLWALQNLLTCSCTIRFPARAPIFFSPCISVIVQTFIWTWRIFICLFSKQWFPFPFLWVAAIFTWTLFTSWGAHFLALIFWVHAILWPQQRLLLHDNSHCWSLLEWF